MNFSFTDNVRKGIIKPPTHRGFNLGQWEKAWNDTPQKTDADRSIYEAGIYINTALSKVRERLGELYQEHYPRITDEKLLRAYISLSNRERHLVSKHIEKIATSEHSVYTPTIQGIVPGNMMSPQEVADGAVDIFSKAIFTCQTRLEQCKQPKTGSEPFNAISFVSHESSLSQLYELYEGYFNSVLWADYKFYKSETDENKVFLEQPFTDIELTHEASQIRKQRQQGQFAAISFSPKIQELLKNDRIIVLERINGKRVLSVKSSLNDSGLSVYSATIKGNILFLMEEFPKEFLLEENKSGFTLFQAFDAFRLLILLSLQLSERFPNDDSYYSISKLLHFCPLISKHELRVAISKSLVIDYEKAKGILDFIEYSSAKKLDLWCHPIIPLGNSHYAFLTSALITPNMTRVAEFWFEEMQCEMKEKGYKYELTVYEEIKKAISQNSIITNYNIESSKKISAGNGSEEIDLIIKIDDLILICEVKSIVTTDSPISKRRTLDILKHGANQAKRKAKFINDNIKEVSNILGWTYSDNTKYNVEQCVITSSKVYSGLTISETPVVDLKILGRYLSVHDLPMLSSIDDKGEETHYAVLVFYKTLNELKDNLMTYLKSPPQIYNDADFFEHDENIIPSFGIAIPQIAHRRIVMKHHDARKILEMDHDFELKISENIDDFLNSSDIILM